MSDSKYVSEAPNNFRTQLGYDIFKGKYALAPEETWLQRAQTIVDHVAGTAGGTQTQLMSNEELKDLTHFIHTFKILPGGRTIYYAGRNVKFYSNCFLFRAEEDTREEWGRVIHKASDALMSGGGIGVDYSILRERHALLRRTGGVASGPVPLAEAVNEYGRRVKQGGSRRSAIYASLNWQHGDADEWMYAKDWENMFIPGTDVTYAEGKHNNFDASAPLDFTNMSFNYDNAYLRSLINGVGVDMEDDELEELALSPDWYNIVENAELPAVFLKNTEMAMRNGEPGFSFNFFAKENQTLRNACCEVTSEDDSDMCNLASINMAACATKAEFIRAVELTAKLLVCVTVRGELPTEKSRLVRERNRRLGVGLMGVHEWLIQRGHPYAMNDDLRSWLKIYRDESRRAAVEHTDRFYLSRPVAFRAIAPTGTIGTMAGTTTGIEPMYATAMKRRYLEPDRESGLEVRKFQYVIDPSVKAVLEQAGISSDNVDTAAKLAETPERRIQFQADVQDYVDMAISSTLNLPSWGSEHNNADRVEHFARTIAKYAPRLRGLTMYPDGARGGQPLVPVPLEEALGKEGVAYEETSELSCKSGVCGI